MADGDSAKAEVIRLRNLLREVTKANEPPSEAEVKEAEAQDYEALLIDLFKQADESGDGTLQSEEFMGVMERSGIGLSSEQVLLLMREADTDGDGNVSYSEVRAARRGAAFGILLSLLPRLATLCAPLCTSTHSPRSPRPPPPLPPPSASTQFMPVALELIEVMEARNKAREDDLDTRMWAEDQALEMEELYAPELMALLDSVNPHFAAADPNASGVVNPPDFIKILKEHASLPPTEINMIIAKIGRDENGNIRIGEFKDVAMEVR